MRISTHKAALRSAIFFSILFVGFMPMLKADCTISGNVNSSSNPFTLPGCSSGVITITGTFTINTSNYNISGLTGITQIIVDGGTIAFSGLGVRIWRLPANTMLTFVNGGSVSTDSPCSALKRIVIGTQVATCNGQFGLADFSFSDVNTSGGFSSTGLLPIELIAFSGEIVDTKIHLSWQTASEVNNDYMAVERSRDGKDFREIGRIPGQGTSEVSHYYEWLDEKPLPGVNYYRLRQVDFDGRVEYHKIIALIFRGDDSKLIVYPSPAINHLNVFLPASDDDEKSILLLNMQGQVLLRKTIPAGQFTEELDVAHLPPGHYQVQLQGSAGLVVGRFVKS